MILGTDKFKPDKKIELNIKNTINGHMMFVGMSGTGKSYNLKKIIEEIMKEVPDAQFHILDVHGDLEVKNSETIRFSEIDNNGLQPLKISDNPYFGGVRKRIRNFISTLNRTSRKLGSKQESVLISLLNDLYIANGFLPEDPKTWSLSYDPRFNSKYPKKYPNIKDLVNFTKGKLKQLYHGANSQAIYQLDILKKEVGKIELILKNAEKNRFDETAKEKELEKLNKQKEKVKEVYNAYIDSIKTGKEFDEILKYDSVEVLKSVYEKITTLESSGIFKDNPLNNKERGKIYRYDIKSLNKDEQKLFVDILLEDIYDLVKEKGEQEYAKTFIVIDEAHIFTTDDDEHILNIIAKEARKFGLGLILASQSFSHFTQSLISNCATKIILGLDEMDHVECAKKIQIDIKRFKYIIPRKTILVQIKEKGSSTNNYNDCVLKT